MRELAAKIGKKKRSDDVAESILIGNYAVRTHQKEYPQAFGI